MLRLLSLFQHSLSSFLQTVQKIIFILTQLLIFLPDDFFDASNHNDPTLSSHKYKAYWSVLWGNKEGEAISGLLIRQPDVGSSGFHGVIL